jgi:hypothetical protein
VVRKWKEMMVHGMNPEKTKQGFVLGNSFFKSFFNIFKSTIHENKKYLKMKKKNEILFLFFVRRYQY